MKGKSTELINTIPLKKDTIKVEYLLKEKTKIKRLLQKDMDDSERANFDNLAGVEYIIYVR